MGKQLGLADEQRRALERLSAVSLLAGYYLAGGAAVAYHVGHRRSRDVDLFSVGRAVDLERVAEAVIATEADGRVLGRTDIALKLVVDGAAVDVVNYSHPPLEPPMASTLGFPVAGLLDLATMKLAAITRRGLRRDVGICTRSSCRASHSRPRSLRTAAASVRRPWTSTTCCAHSRTSTMPNVTRCPKD